MKFEKTKLEGVVIITPDVFGDHRGFSWKAGAKEKWKRLDCSIILCRIIIP